MNANGKPKRGRAKTTGAKPPPPPSTRVLCKKKQAMTRRTQVDFQSLRSAGGLTVTDGGEHSPALGSPSSDPDDYQHAEQTTLPALFSVTYIHPAILIEEEVTTGKRNMHVGWYGLTESIDLEQHSVYLSYSQLALNMTSFLVYGLRERKFFPSHLLAS
ncbi:uncharacterized protein ARMOST_02876 [Armillaria ostoyae]|uniref:Uncharacterized protein n=1 Tax=Armillaria ostoyae TaxID=47428 RepID=A0A284QSW1_ARMOS|nr:uncharacterized protein ARMOST_02876 [Armillaria ostoyae]